MTPRFQRYAPYGLIESGNWIAPFALMAVAAISACLISDPVRLDMMHSMMPASATAGDHADAQARMLASVPLNAAFRPLGLLALTCVPALLLYQYLRLISVPRPLRVSQCIALLVSGQAILQLGALAGSLFPPEAARFPLPAAALSLAWWFSSTSWTMRMLLGCANPFEVAAVILTGLWLSRLSEIHRLKAISISIGLFAILLFIDVCLMQFAAARVGVG